MPTRQTAKKRVGWIDIAKGIAILLVLWGHAMREPMRLESAALDCSYRVIYTFHMAFFFWLSGYVYQMTNGRVSQISMRNFVQKKLKTQFFPWAIYSMFCYIAFAAALHVPSFSRILQSAGYQGGVSLPFFMLRCLQGNNLYAFHLWFIYTLFLISILVAVIDRSIQHFHTKPVFIWIGMIALSFLGTLLERMKLLPFGDWIGLFRYVCMYLPFYLLGILMYSWKLPRTCCMLWGFAALAYMIIRAMFFSGFIGDAIDAPSLPLELLLRYLSYALLPGFMLLLCTFCSWLDTKRTAWLAYLGRASFYIYLLHQPFCCAFIGNALYSKLGVPALPTMFVCLIISIAVPLAWERMMLYLRKLRASAA